MAKAEINQNVIRELATLMEEVGLSELEIGSEENRMRLVRSISISPPQQTSTVISSPLKNESATTEFDYTNHPGAIISPIVGTAFQASSPEEPPFVKIGDQVTAGQTLLVIEAMKTFNEIPSTHTGVVSQIFFENSAPVEYGDVLMIIE